MQDAQDVDAVRFFGENNVVSVLRFRPLCKHVLDGFDAFNGLPCFGVGGELGGFNQEFCIAVGLVCSPVVSGEVVIFGDVEVSGWAVPNYALWLGSHVLTFACARSRTSSAV